MLKFSILCIVALLFSIASVQADPIPDYVLEKDYENCMGGQAPQQDVQRAQYCSCIRNMMRGWDEDAYANLLMEQAKSQTISPQLETLAKGCAEKVLH